MRQRVAARAGVIFRHYDAPDRAAFAQRSGISPARGSAFWWRAIRARARASGRTGFTRRASRPPPRGGAASAPRRPLRCRARRGGSGGGGRADAFISPGLCDRQPSGGARPRAGARGARQGGGGPRRRARRHEPREASAALKASGAFGLRRHRRLPQSRVGLRPLPARRMPRAPEPGTRTR